ncbi:MAG: hypothetical protein AAGF01_07110 [Cyanobacteria bacterium P01_G01_bin.38]
MLGEAEILAPFNTPAGGGDSPPAQAWSSGDKLGCYTSPTCPYAPLHIVQNPKEARPAQHYFMPHRPQPGLLGRDRNRRDRFENIAFLGHRNSLAPELQAQRWRAQLADMGLTWQPIVIQTPGE